jgi:hypothetical protein
MEEEEGWKYLKDYNLGFTRTNNEKFEKLNDFYYKNV